MTEKTTQKENPLIYYIIILIVLGLVAYKWLSEINKTILINYLILMGTELLAVLLFVAIIIFSIKGYMLKEEKSKTIFKIVLFLFNLLIVATFIYRIISIRIIDYSIITHGIITITIFLYYNYVVHKSIFKKKEEHQKEKSKIELEQEEIKDFINTNLGSLSLKELHSKKEYFQYKLYLDASLNPFPRRYYCKLDDLDFTIEKKTKEHELFELEENTRREKQELKDIREEKRIELMDKESKKAERIYSLTHYEDNVITRKITLEEKKELKSAGFKQINEYCICQKKIITVFVKPVLSHSATHTFLVWSTRKLLSEFDVTNIQEHDTRDADVTFTYNNRKYAIEIETGNLLSKKIQLEQKISYLNKKYPKRWFFIVSNRNLQAKYKKYGISTQRNRVSEILEKMLEKTHP